MKAALIHFEPFFSSLDQGIFIKRTLKKVKQTMELGALSLPVYLLPICEKNPSQRAIERFSSYLIEEKIDRILLTRQTAAFSFAEEILEKSFSNFNGAAVINYKIYDILRKYLNAQGKKLVECTVIIETENPEKAKEFILKIYRQVRKIKIRGRNPEKYEEICQYFLQEYGLYITVNDETEEPEKEIIVQLDSLLEKKEALNLSCDCKRNTQIIFYSQKIKEISKILTLNQNTVEFLIFQQYGRITEETVKQFFKEYGLRISKIKNND